MPVSSTEQMRRWTGPALFSYGFRPFFLFGSLWAACAMCLWILVLSGALTLPSRLDPVSWHAHAFLFGYLGAIIAGFLLTAVPNWTGRLPVVGTSLIGVFALWGIGRIAMLFSGLIPFGYAAATDLAFPLVLGAFLLREIVAGRNWRNLPVLLLLMVFTLSDLLFLLEAGRGGNAATGFGMRLGLGSALMMVALIGGRIIPSFTRNWLVKAGHAARPVPPMQRFDKATLALSALALLAWGAAPLHVVTALLLAVIGVLHLIRLSRWQGLMTRREPILFVLHMSYLCLPLGALAVSASILWPGMLAGPATVHLWTAGVIGGMTLSVMSRASLGHTGRDLQASAGTVAVYVALFAATILRFLAGFVPLTGLYQLSGGFWIMAFLGFAIQYAPMLWSAKRSR
jgi:uncharacterized protein involved in response to NO